MTSVCSFARVIEKVDYLNGVEFTVLHHQGTEQTFAVSKDTQAGKEFCREVNEGSRVKITLEAC